MGSGVTFSGSAVVISGTTISVVSFCTGNGNVGIPVPVGETVVDGSSTSASKDGMLVVVFLWLSSGLAPKVVSFVVVVGEEVT